MPEQNPIGEPDRTYFLGLRVSEERRESHDEADGPWSGTVYDQMVPEIKERFRGIEMLPQGVLALIARVRRGERGRFPPRTGDDTSTFHAPGDADA